MSENNPYNGGRGRVIESGAPQARDQLRRPGEDNESGKSSSSSSVGASASSKGLSVDAPVFVPRSAMYNVAPTQEYYSQPVSDQMNGTADSTSVEHTRTILYEMSMDPGQFDTLANYLTDDLNDIIPHIKTLTDVVNEIFEQSLVDSNVRYNGSRLCNHLSNHLTKSFGSQTFRSILLNRCKQEFELRTTYASTPEGRVRLRGFAMLLGELFIHMEIAKDGLHTKIELLGATIPELLDTLLKHASPEDVKCVCQILKFTGAAMEDLPNVLPKKLNDLFQVMSVLAAQESIERTSKDMLQNVIKLREINWGRGTPTTSEPTTPFPLPTNEPVFYGPDGVPISSEEARFLESDKFLYDNQDEELNSCQNTYEWSDGMNEEMEADFEKFLMENS